MPDLATVLAEERRLMNSYAPYYHESLHINSYFYREERRRFVAWVTGLLAADKRNPRATSILNVGCATGHVLQELAGRGFTRLTGLDHAERMLEHAQQRVPGGRFIPGTVEHHDFRGEQFDAVIAGFTLHHMYDARAFFELVDRVVAPGGWFFILEYNAAGWENRLWGRLVFHGLALPFRMLLKLKNRRQLVQPHHPPIEFNPAHRLMTYRRILNAMTSRERYRLQRRTRGLFLPVLNYSLVEESAVDRALHRGLDAVDLIVKPFGAGNLQWIAGQRIR